MPTTNGVAARGKMEKETTRVFVFESGGGGAIGVYISQAPGAFPHPGRAAGV